MDDDPASFESTPDAEDRRILELELAKVRKEAAAARLEARAAELELMIRRLSQQQPDAVESLINDIPEGRVSVEGIQEALVELGSANPEPESKQAGLSGNRVDRPEQTGPSKAASRPASKKASEKSSRPVVFANGGTARSRGPTRAKSADVTESTDLAVGARPAEQAVPRKTRISSWNDVRCSPGRLAPSKPSKPKSEDSNQEKDAREERVTRFDRGTVGPRRPHFSPAVEIERETSSAGTSVLDFEPTEQRPPSVELDAVELEQATEETDQPRRRKPAAFLVSTIAHIAILLLLAAFTLSTRRPKDQVALSASVSDPSEEPMETFELETSEPVIAPSEPTETATALEISPIGTMPMSEISPDSVGPPAPDLSDMLSQSQQSAASMSLKSTSDAKIQFCGVEGGGNHFVYLVDSSGSMGSAFESARGELLQSIDALKPDQRFYVVFFDAESDYMRLSDPNSKERGSVKATAANKQALRRWAVGIKMDRGRAPYDPLRFALDLKPDVIFLLSDGEFPQGIEDLLKEENHFDNLFGDEGLISIVHTIGYHSREGESRMKRIATQNEGQYRHVPKP